MFESPSLAFLGDLSAASEDRRSGGLNPYALGFAMMNDIKRI